MGKIRPLVDRLISVEDGQEMHYLELSADSSDAASLPTTGVVDGSIAIYSDTGAVNVFNETDTEWVEWMTLKES